MGFFIFGKGHTGPLYGCFPSAHRADGLSPGIDTVHKMHTSILESSKIFNRIVLKSDLSPLYVKTLLFAVASLFFISPH